MDGTIIMEDVEISRPSTPMTRTKQDREELGAWLFERISAGQDAKGGLPTVWRQIEAFHRNEPPSEDTAPAHGMSPVHIPFLQPRIDMLCASVSTVVTKQIPYMLVEGIGDEAMSNRLERLIHRHWQVGGFDRAMREVTQHAAITNRGIWRVSFELQTSHVLSENSDQLQDAYEGDVRFSGLKIEGISPEDFVIAPAALDGIQSASLVGHRFYQRAAGIKQLQKAKLYHTDDDEIYGGDSPTQEDITGRYVNTCTSPDVFSGMDDTALVECYDVVFRYAPKEGGFERYFRAVLAFNQKAVLSCEEWPYSRPPYFSSGFLTDITSFWGGRSVGRSLAPMQDQYNKLWSMAYNGGMQQALPAIFGPQIASEKFTQYEPGQYIEIEDPHGPQPFVANSNFNGQWVRMLMMDLQGQGDAVARLSSNSLGAEEAKASISATQTHAIQ